MRRSVGGAIAAEESGADRQGRINRGRISRRGLADDAGWCGACGVTRNHIPGGPGRPSGSYYGEPAIAGRHGRNERQVKACASPVYRKRSGDRNRRKSSADGASLSAPWSAAGRVRGCHPLWHQVARRPCRWVRRLSARGADYVLTEASSGAPLPRDFSGVKEDRGDAPGS